MVGRPGRWLVPGCVAVGLLAFVLRLDFLLAWRETPFFADLFIDSATYDRWASAFASGGDWREGGVYPRAPLYIWFLGSLYDITGGALFLPRLVQVILGSASCVLLVLLGRRFLSTAAALGGGLLMALSWPLVFFDAQILFPTLIVFLELLLLLTMPGKVDGGILRFLLAGVLLGVLVLVNPLALLLLPAFALSYGVAGGNRLKSLAAAAALAAGCLLAVAPVTLQNRLAGGEWVIVSSNGGYNFTVGNNAEADGISVWSSKEVIASAAADAPFRPGFTWVREHPLGFVTLYLKKIYFLVNAREIPSNFLPDHMRSLVPSLAGKAAALGFGIVGPFALLGLLLAFRNPAARPVCIFLVVSSLGIALFFVNARFRAPVLPPLYLMAAGGVSALFGLARKDRRRFAAATVLLVLLAVAVNSRLFGVDSRRHEAPLYGELGKVFARRGLAAEAAEQFRLGLALDPGDVPNRYRLATVLVLLGEYEEAEREFRKVVEADPEFHRAWTALGNLALRRGEAEDAAGLYGRALTIRPDDETATHNLREAMKQLRPPPQGLDSAF